MDWSYQLQIIQILHFCLPCSICAISVLLSLALIWEKNTGQSKRSVHAEHQPHQWYLRGPTKCNHSETFTCNATSATERERFPSPLCPPLLFLEPCVCVKSLPSEVLTYLLLSSAHIFSWPRISSRPSGWPWHSHHTSSLSSLLTETAVQGDSGWVKHFTCKVQEKAVFYFQQLSSGFHSRWKLVPFPQMWDLRLEC